MRECFHKKTFRQAQIQCLTKNIEIDLKSLELHLITIEKKEKFKKQKE